MTLNLFLATLFRNWYALFAGAFLGAVIALAVTRLLPDTYEATSTVLVSTPKAAQPLEGATYLESRMPTYAALSTSRPVLDEAADVLGVSVSRDVLARSVTAFVPEATSLIVLTAQWPDPQGAADLSNAVADSFVGSVPALDNPSRPVLQVEILERALPPEEAAGLPVFVSLAMGATLGLTAVLLTALISTARVARRAGPEQRADRAASAE